MTLTEQEKTVLRGIAEGKSYTDIAFAIDRTYDTVKTYVKRIKAKIGVKNKVGIAVWATRNPEKLK
jgi:DNA-binding NarL/FixJ family response regulator